MTDAYSEFCKILQNTATYTLSKIALESSVRLTISTNVALSYMKDIVTLKLD